MNKNMYFMKLKDGIESSKKSISLSIDRITLSTYTGFQFDKHHKKMNQSFGKVHFNNFKQKESTYNLKNRCKQQIKLYSQGK